RPTLVHTHLPCADLLGALAARWARVPVVVSSRHYDYSFTRRERTRFGSYYRLANRCHDAVVPISARNAVLCKEVEQWPDERIHLVLYGCGEQRVDKRAARSQVLKELRLATDTILLGTVARLIPWKGHRYAVEAL